LYSFDGQKWTSWADSVRRYGDLTGDGEVNIAALAVDGYNVKWFGSSHDGVLSFDGKTWRHYTMEDGLSGNHINCIAVDRENIVWIGTGVIGIDSGITSYDRKTGKFKKNTEIFGAGLAIAVDDNNTKWVTSAAKTTTLYSFDGATWKSYSPGWEAGLGGYVSIAIDRDGTKWLGSDKMGVVCFRETNGFSTLVQYPREQPRRYVLLGNRPNPFNPSTTIEFTLPSSAPVRLDVYSISGQKIATLVNGSLSAGNHSVIFDGSKYSSGVYFFRFESPGLTTTGKMLLLK
jgi:hypothetical protein